MDDSFVCVFIFLDSDFFFFLFRWQINKPMSRRPQSERYAEREGGSQNSQITNFFFGVFVESMKQCRRFAATMYQQVCTHCQAQCSRFMFATIWCVRACALFHQFLSIHQSHSTAKTVQRVRSTKLAYFV